MEIKTKFNVGDEVYTLLLGRYKFTFYIVKVKVLTVDTITGENKKTFISYTFKYNGELRNANEYDCFATKEEAQKECDKRNAEK
jgi:hypothetical protein